MAWVAVDMDSRECIFENEPYRNIDFDAWFRESKSENERVQLPKGSIFKLIGKELTWEDEPIELK